MSRLCVIAIGRIMTSCMPNDKLTCNDSFVVWPHGFVETHDLKIEDIFVSWSQTGQTVDVGCCLPRRRRRHISVVYDGTVDNCRATEIPLQRHASLLNIALTRQRRNIRLWTKRHSSAWPVATLVELPYRNSAKRCSRFFSNRSLWFSSAFIL